MISVPFALPCTIDLVRSPLPDKGLPASATDFRPFLLTLRATFPGRLPHLGKNAPVIWLAPFTVSCSRAHLIAILALVGWQWMSAYHTFFAGIAVLGGTRPPPLNAELFHPTPNCRTPATSFVGHLLQRPTLLAVSGSQPSFIPIDQIASRSPVCRPSAAALDVVSFHPVCDCH